ncbi:MAG: HMA2 domain-containing protein [Thermodesulfobacteriota bacterium]
MSHYIHHVPGRLRIRSQLLKNNHQMLEDVKKCFRGAAGIEHIKVSPVTGSALIRYDPNEIKSDQILSILHDCEYVDVYQAKSLDEKLTASVSRAGHFVGKACLNLFVDHALQGSRLALLSAFI